MYNMNAILQYNWLVRFTVEGLEGTLNIIAGQYADSGEYSCTVTIVSQGGNQTLSSSFFFEVKGKRSMS